MLRTRLLTLAACRRRFGYRRLHLLLRREGFAVNHKKLYRIYREEKLVVRKRGGRKWALGTRAPIVVPQGKNQRWSLDFVSDAFADGRRLRVLTVVDDFTREWSGIGRRYVAVGRSRGARTGRDHRRYPARNLAIFLLSIKAGLRAKEIASLTWDMPTEAEGNLGISASSARRSEQRLVGQGDPFEQGPQERSSETS